MRLVRMWDIIAAPELTWKKIKEEKNGVRQLLIGYAAPLALVPVFSSAARAVLLRSHFITLSFLLDLFLASLVNFILSLASVLLAGWLVSILARYFSSRTDLDSCMKTVVYSMTPVWLAAIFRIFPRLHALSMLGLYGAYLLFSALPVVLETPPEKAAGFAASIIGIGVIMIMYLSLISGGIFYS